MAIGNRTFQSKPKYRNEGSKLIVDHSEYIGDLVGTTAAFAVIKTVNLNPGLGSAFPWLNQIASRYESYKFRKMNMRFMTERPTTESGYVAIVPDFDPTDAAPADKQTAFQFQSAAKAAPWENLTQVCNREDLSKRKTYFVRQGALASNENLGLYDTANIFICAGGNSGAVTLGELWADYSVELETPQLDSNYGASNSGRVVGGGGGLTAAAIFGLSPTVTFSRENLFSLDPTNGTLTFLQNYQGFCNLELTGTGLVTGLTSGTVTLTGITEIVNTAGTSLDKDFVLTALAGQTLILSATATTVTASNLRVAGYQASLG